MIKRFLWMLIERYGLDLCVKKLQDKRAMQRCVDQCDASGAQFFPEAKVFNFQNDKPAIRLGDKTCIRGELLVFPYGGKITLGRECYLGEGSRIWSDNSVEIGDHVLIAHHVTISDTNAHELDHQERAEGFRQLLAKGHPKQRPNVESAAVKIGSNAWINFGVSILKGVTIGEGAIVAAGSVVTKDVPPFTVVAGNPAKVIRELETTS